VTASPAFSGAVADHRAAVESVADALRRVELSAWRVPVRPGKWTPAEIAHHLALSYGPPLSELSGGPGYAVRVPWWKRRLLRWKFLGGIVRRGEFPAGAPAPRETRPGADTLGQPESVGRLRDAASLFERRLAEASAGRRLRLHHAYFGPLTPRQTLKLLAAHAYHHEKQLPGAPGGEDPR
jgi:hypothetical protein